MANDVFIKRSTYLLYEYSEQKNYKMVLYLESWPKRNTSAITSETAEAKVILKV
jgi:hypothetical protein